MKLAVLSTDYVIAAQYNTISDEKNVNTTKIIITDLNVHLYLVVFVGTLASQQERLLC